MIIVKNGNLKEYLICNNSPKILILTKYMISLMKESLIAKRGVFAKTLYGVLLCYEFWKNISKLNLALFFRKS